MHQTGVNVCSLGLAGVIALAACAPTGTSTPTTSPTSPAASAPSSVAGAPNASPSAVQYISLSPSPSSAPSPSLVLPSSPSPSVSASPSTAPLIGTYSGPHTALTVAYTSPDPGYLALFVGIQTGIFAQYGLDVTPLFISTSSGAVSALLAGQAQFIQSGASAAVGPDAHGADLSVLAIWIPTYNYFMDTVPDVHTADDLKGKIVAADSPGGSADVALAAALQHLGLNSSDVSILELGPTNVRTAALESGQIQGTIEGPPENFDLEAQGYNRLLDMASLHLPFSGQSTIGERSYMSANPDVTQRYVDAMMEANLRVKSDEAASIAAMGTLIPGTSQEDMDKTWTYYAQEVFPDVPTPSPDLMTQAIQTLSQTDPSVSSVDLSTLLDPSYVQKAQAQGIG